MENKFPDSINIKSANSIIDNPTVSLLWRGLNLQLSIDTQERIFSFKYQSDKSIWYWDVLAQMLKETLVKDAFLISKKKFNEFCLSHDLDAKLLKNDELNIESMLMGIRALLADYMGYVGALGYKEDLICRCTGLGKSDIHIAFKDNQGLAKEVYLKTNIAGVCGTCKGQVEKIFTILEDKEKSIFGKDKGELIDKINELINEFYLVCPQDFSELKFELISVSPRGIKIRCIRPSAKPVRSVIQDSLNNFFTGQFDRELPVSVVL